MTDQCKLLFGLEGAILQAKLGTFQELDILADTQLLMAAETLKPGGEHAGKTFVTILLHENGSLTYAKRYTVSH